MRKKIHFILILSAVMGGFMSKEAFVSVTLSTSFQPNDVNLLDNCSEEEFIQAVHKAIDIQVQNIYNDWYLTTEKIEVSVINR